MYIQPYSDINKNAVFDNDILIIHYNIIRVINYFIKSSDFKGIARINLILVNTPQSDMELVRMGNIVDVNFHYHENIFDKEEIFISYKLFFKELEKQLKLESDIYSAFERIEISAINGSDRFSDYFSAKKWDESRNNYYRLFFVCKDIKDINLYVNFFNREGVLENSVLFLTAPCGVVIKDALKYNIKEHMYEQSDVKIYGSNERNYWKVNISGKVWFYYDNAERNIPQGQYELGKMYLEGRSVLKDINAGKFWLQKAADQGYIRAKELLKKI